MARHPLTPERQALLDGISQRYGAGAVPADPESMPDTYWKGAASALGDTQGPSALQRILGSAAEKVGGIDEAADKYADDPRARGTPLGLAAGAFKHAWSPAYDKVIQPTLERAEEVGQLIGSPILQAIKDTGTPAGPDTLSDYAKQFQAYRKNIRGSDGGLDFKGATEAATAAPGYDKYVVGAAGLLADPTNLIPGKAVTAIPKAAARVGQAAKGGVRAAATQVGREAVSGVKAYPGAR